MAVINGQLTGNKKQTTGQTAGKTEKTPRMFETGGVNARCIAMEKLQDFEFYDHGEPIPLHWLDVLPQLKGKGQM